METKKLEINKQEAELLTGIINIAIKTEGLPVAQNCLYMATKIANLFREEVKDEPKEEIKEEIKEDEEVK
jgi:hypothetical protein